MSSKVLLYGSYGYTGKIIAELAAQRGFPMILSGRNTNTVVELARELAMEARPFSLEDEQAGISVLKDIDVVIHCAGPFRHTYRKMVELCIKTKTHYLDITGEPDVFEGVAKMHEQALKVGVMLLPGAGFDVVPSDCLANHVKSRLPDATHMALAFRLNNSGISQGTMKTVVENLAEGGRIRREGKLVTVPMAWDTRQIDFDAGKPDHCITIPWGDVVTAWHSTGIDNISVYAPAPMLVAMLAKISRPLHKIFGIKFIQDGLLKLVGLLPKGPNEDVRTAAHVDLWAEARNSKGKVVRSRLRTPSTYVLTGETVLHIAKKVTEGDFKAGFQTPAQVFGKDFILKFGDSKFIDL
jgi:short subunit dehydrogenase-like uncharacterized protein